jgi:hypothetical protein
VQVININGATVVFYVFASARKTSVVTHDNVSSRVMQNLSNAGIGKRGVEKDKNLAGLQCTDDRKDRRRIVLHENGNGLIANCSPL